MTTAMQRHKRHERHQGTQLLLDWTRCDGHGLCAALLPRAVALDEWGYPVIDRNSAAVTPESELRRAVSACPALALRLAAS